MPDLRGLPGVARVVEASPEEFDAVYYDTADLALLSGRSTVRRSTGGHDAGWHLETPGPPAGTTDLPVRTGEAGSLPDELALLIRGRARGRTVAPVAHLHIHRERRQLVDSEGRTLVEIASDDVSAHVMGVEGADTAADRTGTAPDVRPATAGTPPAASTGARLTAWTEAEIAPRQGDDSLLTTLRDRLRSAGLRSAGRLHADDTSRLQRALSGAGVEPRDAGTAAAPDPDSAAAAVLNRLRAQTDLLLAVDAGIRADVPGSVRRMRIAASRLRAVLRTNRRLFRPDRTRSLERELAWLRSVLGEARDHEVVAERLHAEASALRSNPRVAFPDSGTAGQLAAHESHAYRQAWLRAARKLDSERYFTLLDTLDAWITDPPFAAKAHGKAAKRLKKGVRREHRKLTARLDKALSMPPGRERDAALHSARKCAKRLRYAAETACPAAGEPAVRLAKRAKAVQRVLGAHQDAVVARNALPALADQAHSDRQNTFVHGLLYAHLLNEADRRAAETASVWRKASHPKITRLR